MPENNLIPAILILRNNIEVSSQFVHSIRVEFGFSKIPKATILLNDGNRTDHNFAESEKQEWQVGEMLDIKFGYNKQFDLVFSGVITKQGIQSSKNQNSKLYLELRHRYYLSTIKKNSRIFLDKKDSEAIQEILTEYGFENKVASSPEIHRQIIQFNSSDWDFINRRAETNNNYVLPKNDHLLIKDIIGSDEENAKLIFGDNILQLNLETDSRFSFETFSSKTWDAADQQILEVESSAEILSSAGSSSSLEIAKKSKHGKDEFLGLGTISEMEATSISNRNKINAELSKIRGTIKCSGNNDPTIGDWIKLEGVGTQFSGKLLVTGIVHEISARKWHTTFEIGTRPELFGKRNIDLNENPASSLLPGMNGLQIGIVSKLESSQDDEKILVQLPHIQQGKGAVWARCARMEAGKARGWIFRPDIGDEVILGFINDDPQQAIILGSMHSSKNPSPILAEDENDLKGYTSRENLKLMFDDDQKTITISTTIATFELNDSAKKITIKNAGNAIEMSESGIKIETQKDFKIKALGDIEIEGRNVKLKANAQFSAEGNAGIKVSSDAVTVIKGSTIKIN